MLLLIFEFLGTTELLVILLVALVIFGPRKLPQMTRSVAKSIGEFKRASEDFKRTWEKEVAVEEAEKEARISRALLTEDKSILDQTVERSQAVRDAAEADSTDGTVWEASTSQPTSDPDLTSPTAAIATDDEALSTASATRKRDWL